ncbi:MAG: redoxin domain-containing protein [FCB group bacterium]|jgi:hypothetical protein|nr:redoxin domain-containing protein [FCB group bacterium]
MKTRKRLLLCLLCTLLIARLAHSAYVGDPAPPLDVTTWVRDPVTNVFDGSRIIVIEMWTTWCRYCVQSIPGMTYQQSKYPTTVRVIGVSNESSSTVIPFVNARKTTMVYSVGCDDGTIFDDWGVGGIPDAYIVDQSGRIAWRGHPYYIDEPLAQIVANGIFFNQGLAPGFPHEGEDFTFSVEMANDNPVTYSWTHNGVPIGGNSPTLTLTNITLADAGKYICTATSVNSPQIFQRSERTLMVLSAGEDMPAASAWSIALLAGILAMCGAAVKMRRPRTAGN